MGEAIVKGRLLKWGNSMGVRIPKSDARRLNLREGADVTVRIESSPSAVDLTDVPVLHGSGREARDHDKILGQARRRELSR